MCAHRSRNLLADSPAICSVTAGTSYGQAGALRPVSPEPAALGQAPAGKPGSTQLLERYGEIGVVENRLDAGEKIGVAPDSPLGLG